MNYNNIYHSSEFLEILIRYKIASHLWSETRPKVHLPIYSKIKQFFSVDSLRHEEAKEENDHRKPEQIFLHAFGFGK